MNRVTPTLDLTWASTSACTLPTVEQPLRHQEFGDLFRSVLSVTPTDATTATFALRPDPGVAAQAADLIARETQCCSFFTFALIARHGGLDLSVTVPPQHQAILAGLVSHAQTLTGDSGQAQPVADVKPWPPGEPPAAG